MCVVATRNLGGHLKVLRVIKATLGTTITWGAVWSVLIIPSLVFLLRSGVPAMSSVTTSTLVWSWAVHAWPDAFAQRATLGLGFALLLYLSARFLPTLRYRSLPVIGVVGAIATATVGVVALGPALSLAGGALLAMLGAGTAMGSLSRARRAPATRLDASSEPPRITAP